MTPPPQPGGGTTRKVAAGTVTVIAVLVGLFCVLPALVCGTLAILGVFADQARP